MLSKPMLTLHEVAELLKVKESTVRAWIKDGLVKYREDVWNGLEQAPGAFIAMLRGDNFGKLMIKLPQ